MENITWRLNKEWRKNRTLEWDNGINSNYLFDIAPKL